jgi:hypothetical protein
MKNTASITHYSQLLKGAIYVVEGRTARFTGVVKRVAPLFTRRPIFREHGVRFSAKITKVRRATIPEVAAYLGKTVADMRG